MIIPHNHIANHIVTGWWFQPHLKNNEFVSWDYEIPQYVKNKKNAPITTNQYTSVNV